MGPVGRVVAALAAQIRRSDADAVVLMGAFRIGSTLLTDLRAAVGPQLPLVGSDGFQVVFKELANSGREVEGLYVAVPGMPLERLDRAGAGSSRRSRTASVTGPRRSPCKRERRPKCCWR